jgi:hypothetical protein
LFSERKEKIAEKSPASNEVSDLFHRSTADVTCGVAKIPNGMPCYKRSVYSPPEMRGKPRTLLVA